MKIDKKIIKEEDIILNNKQYKEITFEDGEKILRKQDPKTKMWITLRFKPDTYDDSPNIEKFKEIRHKFMSERLNHFYKEFRENAKNFYIMCETLDIPFTGEEGKIRKAFIEQYIDLGSISDKDAENEKAYKRLVDKTNGIINKSNFVMSSKNNELIEKVKNKQVTISEAYQQLQVNKKRD